MSDNKEKNEGLNINAKAFVGALAVIAALMVLAYVMTIVIPCEGIPFWKWILSPVLVLGASGNATLIAVLIFLLVIGGVFNALGLCGLMKYMLNSIAAKYADKRYKLMAIVMLFFMSLGSLIGSFEECVPMVPIVVALAIRLGWDAITGLAMSLLAVGCGFAAGVFNPFTVGLAQTLCGLPMFSAAWFRAINFVCIYALLLLFVRTHAKKVDRGVQSEEGEKFIKDAKMDKGVKLFAAILGTGIVIILSSSVLTFLQDYTMIIVAVMFLIAGIASSTACGMKGKELASAMGGGVVTMLPAVLMILMASSIKFTLEEAGVLTTMVNKAIEIASTLPKWELVLFIYLIVLVMNFFIASGSAKAIMLIPLVVPLAEAFGISAQLCIVAYAFGDGFSNVFYPTNPALLIALGLAGINYIDWFKWSSKFQLANLCLTSGLLLIGLAIGL